MLDRTTVLQTLEAQRAEIRRLGVKRLRLVGSLARDEQHASSDIDFVVEFEEGRGLFQDMSDLQVLLEDTFRCEVDLIKPHLVREELQPSLLGGTQYEARL